MGGFRGVYFGIYIRYNSLCKIVSQFCWEERVSESIIVVSIVVLLRHIVKTGILGPSVIFSVISLGQMLVFYLAVELTLYPEIMAGWWQVSTEYKTSTVEVLIVYLYLIFVSYCSSVSIDKAKSEDENLKKVLYLHFLESKVFFLIIFALFMLCVLHPC